MKVKGLDFLMSYHHKGARKYQFVGGTMFWTFSTRQINQQKSIEILCKIDFRERLVLHLHLVLAQQVFQFGITNLVTSHCFAPFKLVNLPILLGCLLANHLLERDHHTFSRVHQESHVALRSQTSVSHCTWHQRAIGIELQLLWEIHCRNLDL